jgi:hypothetical protein
MQLKLSLFEEISLLIDPTEMQDFLNVVPEGFFVDASSPFLEPHLVKKDFLKEYTNYVENLKKGDYTDPGSSFHLRYVIDEKIVKFKSVAQGKWILFFEHPPIHLKHTTAIVCSDQSWKMHVFGKSRIFLGITFQYPRIYEGEDRIAKKTVGRKEFLAFRLLSRWVKEHTFPLKVNRQPLEVRVSEKSLKWLKMTPQLKKYFDSGVLE